MTVSEDDLWFRTDRALPNNYYWARMPGHRAEIVLVHNGSILFHGTDVVVEDFYSVEWRGPIEADQYFEERMKWLMDQVDLD